MQTACSCVWILEWGSLNFKNFAAIGQIFPEKIGHLPVIDKCPIFYEHLAIDKTTLVDADKA
jgi:hypothetical protein